MSKEKFSQSEPPVGFQEPAAIETLESKEKERQIEAMVDLRMRVDKFLPLDSTNDFFASQVDGKETTWGDYYRRNGDSEYAPERLNPKPGAPKYPERDSVYFTMYHELLSAGTERYKLIASARTDGESKEARERMSEVDPTKDYPQYDRLNTALTALEQLQKKGSTSEAREVGRDFLHCQIDHYKATYEARIDNFLQKEMFWDKLRREERDVQTNKWKTIYLPVESSAKAKAVKEHYLKKGEELFAAADQILQNNELTPVQAKSRLDNLFINETFVVTLETDEGIVQIRDEHIPGYLTAPFKFDNFTERASTSASE